MAVFYNKGKEAGKVTTKNGTAIAVIAAAVIALLIISGCTSQQPQAPQDLQTASKLQEAAAPLPAPTEQQQPVPPAAEDDLYKDNLGQSLDELSQLE